MSVMLFIVVVIASFIIVRIGAIAFQLTGLEWTLAKFQALSCFSGTGFTTSESELVTGHPQRRRIATVLMVLGNAGLVTMIASIANALNPQQTLWAKLSESILPFDVPHSLIPWLNLSLIIIALYIMYKLSLNKKLIKKLTNFLRIKIIKREMIERVSFEELMLTTGGYGVAKISVCADSPVLNKTLSESAIRSQDITVLAITRKGKTTANPPANTQLLLNDDLLCFGKLENIKTKICTTP